MFRRTPYQRLITLTLLSMIMTSLTIYLISIGELGFPDSILEIPYEAIASHLGKLDLIGSYRLTPNQQEIIPVESSKMYLVVETDLDCNITISVKENTTIRKTLPKKELTPNETRVFMVYTPCSNCSIGILVSECNKSTMDVYVYGMEASDVNLDNKTDETDIQAVLELYGISYSTNAGTNNYNPFLDVNADGTIDYRDIAIIARTMADITPRKETMEVNVGLRRAGDKGLKQHLPITMTGQSESVELVLSPEDPVWAIEIAFNSNSSSQLKVEFIEGKGWDMLSIRKNTLILYKTEVNASETPLHIKFTVVESKEAPSISEVRLHVNLADSVGRPLLREPTTLSLMVSIVPASSKVSVGTQNATKTTTITVQTKTIPTKEWWRLPLLTVVLLVSITSFATVLLLRPRP